MHVVPKGCRPQERFERRCREGLCEQKSLRLVAALRPQEIGLRDGLHPFGDHPQPEIVRHRDQRANDRDELVVVGKSADEALVDLDAGQRHLCEEAERGKAGTEVVEGDMDTELPQPAKGRERRRIAIERDIFGDLEFEGIGRESGGGKNLLQLGDERWTMKLARKQVDGDTSRLQAHASPGGCGFARRAENPAADRGGDRTGGKHLDECAGGHDRAALIPPQQGLRSDHRRIRKPHLRLEIELELALRIGLSQLEFQLPAGMHIGAQRVVKEHGLAAAVRLGLVKGHVDVCDQLLDVGPVGRRHGNAGARADEDHRAGDLEWFLERLQHRPGDFRDPAGIAAIRNQHDELVAAEPVDAVAVADDGGPAVGNLLEESIAAGVSHGVVDLFEAVEVEQGDRCRRGGCGRIALESFLQLAVERRAVRQARQRIRISELPQLFAQHLACGGVADDGEDKSVGSRQRAQHDVDRKFTAVLPTAAQLGTSAHGTHGRAELKRRAEMHVAMPSPFRQENFDRLADQQFRRVIEHGGQLAVDLPDDTAAVDGDDGIGDEVNRYHTVRHGCLCIGAAANRAAC